MTSVRRSTRITSVTSRQRIRDIAAQLNRPTSSDSDSGEYQEDNLVHDRDELSDLSQNNHEAEDEVSVYEGDDEDDSTRDDSDNDMAQLDGGITPDSLSATSDGAQGSVKCDDNNRTELEKFINAVGSNTFHQYPERALRLTQTLDLNVPPTSEYRQLREVSDLGASRNLVRSRIMSTSEGQISQAAADPNRRPSAWRRQVMRLRKFLDRLYRGEDRRLS